MTWTTWFARWLEPAQQMLTEKRVKALEAEGQSMTLEQAIDHALEWDR
jgi:hypothetical protein